MMSKRHINNTYSNGISTMFTWGEDLEGGRGTGFKKEISAIKYGYAKC